MSTDNIYTVTMTDENNTKLRIISAKGKSPTLEEAQEFVGGYVIMAPIVNPPEKMQMQTQMLANEDGELLQLKRNSNASRVCGYSIYGDAILLKGDACWS